MDFPLAYTNYEQAILDFSKAVLTSNIESAPAVDKLERKVDEKLVILNTKASVRISSLTKNDGDLMKVSLEIADLAGKELDTLKAYQSAASTRNTDLEQLAREFRDLTNQRQTAYSRYLELAGQKN